MLGAKGSAPEKDSEGDADMDAEAGPPVGEAEEVQKENDKPEVRAAAWKHASGSAFDACFPCQADCPAHHPSRIPASTCTPTTPETSSRW